MPVRQVDVPGVGIVNLYKRRGSRSIRLSVKSDGQVRVTLPYWVPYQAGVKFARAKTAWIMAEQGTRTVPPLVDGAAIGKAHRLRFLASSTVTRASARLTDNLIRVTYPAALNWNAATVQTAARRGSIKALQREAEQLLPQRLANLAEQHSFQFRGVTCKQLKSRWGSCNERGDITLNIFLLQLPWELIDYVILHELTHTKVMRHGPPFWAELEKHVPEAKNLRKTLHAHQPTLGV